MIFLGDEDEENDAAHDDPHKALGAINLDDLDSIPAYVPIDTTKDQIGDMFGSSSSGKKIQSQSTDDNAKSKKKKSKEKKEKKSKKSKKSKSDPDQLLVETDNNRVVQVNGSNNKTENTKAAEQAHDQTDDLEFWLSPSNQLPAAPSSVEKPQQDEPPTKSEEKSKKKHKKKSSKHDKHTGSVMANWVFLISFEIEICKLDCFGRCF